jgi:hypothetical protein
LTGGGCKAQVVEGCNPSIDGDCQAVVSCTDEVLNGEDGCLTCVKARFQGKVTGRVRFHRWNWYAWDVNSFSAQVIFHADCDDGATPFGDASASVQKALLKTLKATMLSECANLKVVPAGGHLIAFPDDDL